jgi:predicted dehydrogenase
MPLKIVVAGAGHMGRIHLEKLMAMEGVEVSGIVDVDTERAKGLAQGGRVPCFADYRDAVDRSNGVVIATPTESHFEIGKAFLEAGCHVFVEKPVTSNAGEARKLIDLAREKALVFQVGHLERFNPVFAKAASEIKRPLYIEACRVSPFTGRSTDVTVILDVMIHDIDLVLSLVKDRVKEVRAQGSPFLSEKLDIANAWVEFENGCVAKLTASRVAVGRERRIAIFEKERYFSADLLGGKLVVASRAKDGTLETIDFEPPKADSVKEELTEFVQSIRGEAKPSVTGDDGLNALLLADLIDHHIAARSAISRF